jgi:uncharacterized membrane protein
MNSVQMHLSLTHVPVILSIIGMLTLVTAFILKNNTVTKTAYIMIVLAGVAAIPVFFTGEGTEEAIENLPGVSENIIESHEDIAKLAMISIAITGLVAFSAMFLFNWKTTARAGRVAVLVLALVSGVLMAQTAHLGGQIRHSEIRNGMAVQQNESGSEINANGQEKEEDD